MPTVHSPHSLSSAFTQNPLLRINPQVPMSKLSFIHIQMIAFSTCTNFFKLLLSLANLPSICPLYRQTSLRILLSVSHAVFLSLQAPLLLNLPLHTFHPQSRSQIIHVLTTRLHLSQRFTIPITPYMPPVFIQSLLEPHHILHLPHSRSTIVNNNALSTHDCTILACHLLDNLVFFSCSFTFAHRPLTLLNLIFASSFLLSHDPSTIILSLSFMQKSRHSSFWSLLLSSNFPITSFIAFTPPSNSSLRSHNRRIICKQQLLKPYLFHFTPIPLPCTCPCKRTTWYPHAFNPHLRTLSQTPRKQPCRTHTFHSTHIYSVVSCKTISVSNIFHFSPYLSS